MIWQQRLSEYEKHVVFKTAAPVGTHSVTHVQMIHKTVCRAPHLLNNRPGKHVRLFLASSAPMLAPPS